MFLPLSNCTFQDVYYFYDLKVDSDKLPQLMTEKKAFLTIKHLIKENKKYKVLAYYQVYFELEKTDEIVNDTEAVLQTKPRKNTRSRN